ncbi:ribosome maturation factor RimM [Erythrobacter rubeus]|uniref:Ribosome maturation factor RimM n=1 Tax=Erythrobacter rubeus TaxID=2760803 RepID=A0ABR8KPZ5_9SPHN|nr:ribosome maturation factor RimM [Erythrobacter rubeus]MBD2841560.1 16S rRNA processing protein RimM [Erythrobacter rubeus]
MPDQRDARRTVELAAITGAHGVTGEVRLKMFGDGVEALSAHTGFNEGALNLKKVRSDNKGGAIARFAEVTNRTQAEKLRGTVLKVSRDALPQLEEGEFYHADLIGLAVQTDEGDTLGKVIGVHNFGATDVIEIEKDPIPVKGMKTFMIPMTKAAVTTWDQSRMVIAKEFAE